MRNALWKKAKKIISGTSAITTLDKELINSDIRRSTLKVKVLSSAATAPGS